MPWVQPLKKRREREKEREREESNTTKKLHAKKFIKALFIISKNKKLK